MIRVRVRGGRLEYRVGPPPAGLLRVCCRMGLHFMLLDFPRDGYFCRCGRQFLLGEQVRGSLWR